MKFSIHLVLILISFSYACNSKKTKEEVKIITIEDSKINDSLTFDDIKEKLFYVHPTDDSNFCDLSKIIETDCGVGYYYFNKKGKVTFTFECVGDTSILYFLGSYKANKDKITCQFEYSYECFFDSIGNSFKGTGKLLKEKELINMDVYKSECKGIYGFNNGAEKSEEKEFYILQKANKVQSEIFWNFFRQSKVRKEYL